MAKRTKSTAVKDKADNQSEDTKPQDSQRIFEERFALFMNEFQAACEKEDVLVAVAIVVDPRLPGTPLVCNMGDLYDQCKLLTGTLRILRSKLIKELTP